MRPKKKHLSILLVFVGLLGVLGCGPGGPRTYPVSGKLDLAGEDIAALGGSYVEAVLPSEPTVRASGEIQPDGSFTLETLLAGAIRKGAREGVYQVRIVLTDEDPSSKRRAARAIARRFLRFETSGLSLHVPAESDVTLKVSR